MADAVILDVAEYFSNKRLNGSAIQARFRCIGKYRIAPIVRFLPMQAIS
jgi:hypothetical protein